MFERFTERARRVIVLAQECAREIGHEFIGTEHLLYGLAAEEHGIAAQILAQYGVTSEVVRADIERIVGRESESTTGQLRFTSRAKKVLDMALREALSRGHTYIGTEHILLALQRVGGDSGARILAVHGIISSHQLRDDVLAFEATKRVPQTITLTLSLDAANWMCEVTSAMPRNHVASGEVYDAIQGVMATFTRNDPESKEPVD